MNLRQGAAFILAVTTLPIAVALLVGHWYHNDRNLLGGDLALLYFGVSFLVVGTVENWTLYMTHVKRGEGSKSEEDDVNDSMSVATIVHVGMLVVGLRWGGLAVGWGLWIVIHICVVLLVAYVEKRQRRKRAK